MKNNPKYNSRAVINNLCSGKQVLIRGEAEAYVDKVDYENRLVRVVAANSGHDIWEPISDVTIGWSK